VSYHCSESPCPNRPTEDKIDNLKDSFYKELERVFDRFPK
jgi:hypothetical protein